MDSPISKLYLSSKRALITIPPDSISRLLWDPEYSISIIVPRKMFSL